MKKIAITILAGLYSLIVRLSQATYRLLPFRIRKVGAKVISVGNITCGGTGKTPLSIKLAKDLSYYGKRVAVLTRGYGEDEVAELRKKLEGIPVVVGRDRVKTARQAVAEHKAEYLILDDGFQHIRLHRDLDIVNVNTTEPFGPGGILPAGTLREPVSHLRRAQVFVLTKCDIGAKNVPLLRQSLQKIQPKGQIFESVHRPTRFVDYPRGRSFALHELKGHRAGVISGIGDPHSFERSVEHLGVDIVCAARFDDHHPYTAAELTEFVESCKSLGLRDAITTEKDYHRIEPFLQTLPDLLMLNFLVLEIEFEVADEEAFLRRCLNP